MSRNLRRLSALVACALAAPLLFSTATAAAQTFDDPDGDVLACSGECSSFDQDLQRVEVNASGGQVSFTIEQYGAFTGPTVCRCYFPQLYVYLGSTTPAKPDYYTAAWSGPFPYPIALFDRSLTQTGLGVNNCPIPSGFNGVGKLADIPSVIPSATSVTYSFDLAAIGNPGSFDWRVARARGEHLSDDRATPSPTRAMWCPIRALPPSAAARVAAGSPRR